eukprot:9284867-Heterocapsa_arctica.AAC.1
MIDILDFYGPSFKLKTLGERHDTEIKDETNYFVDRGPAALAASLATSITLFASSTVSACVYALLPDKLPFFMDQQMKGVAGATLVIAS